MTEPTALAKPLLAAAAVVLLISTPVALARFAEAHPVAERLPIADPAVAACVRMGHVSQLVSADASYRQVLVEVDAAKAEAETATNEDPSWRPLLGAVGAIDAGLRTDDASESSVGVSVLRYTCRGVVR